MIVSLNSAESGITLLMNIFIYLKYYQLCALEFSEMLVEIFEMTCYFFDGSLPSEFRAQRHVSFLSLLTNQLQ